MITRNIFELESKALEVYSMLGYADATINSKMKVAKELMCLHHEQTKTQLCMNIVTDYVKYLDDSYQNNKVVRTRFMQSKHTVKQLVQICQTGAINNQHTMLPPIPDCFEMILTNMRNSESPLWLDKYIRVFLRWITARGCNNIGCVDESIVREYLIDCSSRMVGDSLNHTMRALKYFFQFLSTDGTLSEQMNRLFLFNAITNKRIQKAMPQDDIAAVLNVININTNRGVRDYAIILLATVTGLRGCDIIAMSDSNIDRHNGEIQIVQEKTGVALALPLTTDIGTAIDKYILTARPRSNSNKLFLRMNAPYEELRTVKNILPNYLSRAGIQKRWSFHSLRRSLATNMIASGTSVYDVAQTLGHGNIDSTKQYISVDTLNLKKCALDFSGISIGGDGK